MYRYVIVLILCCVSYGSSEDLKYFCKYNCGGTQNTACTLAPCAVSKECGTVEATLLDDASREVIVKIHNELRNKIAKGEDTQGGNSAASDMNVLSYDRELEFVAQCWANTCESKGIHDSCRSTSAFNMVGQNMFYMGTTGNLDANDHSLLEKAVKAWYSEIQYTTTSHIDRFKITGTKGVIGHFTQVVWSKTTHVGCGRIIAKSGSSKKMYLYCNYGPAGNMLGSPVYKRGNPCEACSGKCNDKYTGLCGTIKPLSDDKFVNPFGKY